VCLLLVRVWYYHVGLPQSKNEALKGGFLGVLWVLWP